jgi:hypothetical protein
MAFEHLPNETLIDIVKYAGIDGTISSWVNLAGCNQTLNRIATPMLYLNFIESGCKSAPKLLRTALSNPQLANYVRRYTGKGIPKGEFLDVSDFSHLDFTACQERLNALQVTLKETGATIEDMENWVIGIRKGRWHAVTSLLVLLLPNLEDIEMINYRHDDTGDMEHALALAARLQGSGISSPFSLEHLADVSLSPFAQPDVPEAEDPLGFYLWPESEYLHFSDMEPFLRLPSVESVAVSRLTSDGTGSGFSQLFAAPEPFRFSTKELEITDSCVDAWWLVRFLRVFISLRKFSYNHVAKEQDPDFLPQDIGKAIAHLHSCLEELEISDICEQNGKWTAPREIGSLAEFERLKSIEVSGSILFGYPDDQDGSIPVVRLCEVLPKSVERLVLYEIGGLCDEQNLRELLAVKEERFPSLKRIQMKGSCCKDADKLKKDFKAKGVKLLL